MNNSTFKRQSCLFAVVTALAVGSPAAFSQTDDDAELIEEIVTTGTRKKGQSPTETLSPIDVLGGEALTNQAAFDLTESITKIAPSLNTPTRSRTNQPATSQAAASPHSALALTAPPAYGVRRRDARRPPTQSPQPLETTRESPGTPIALQQPHAN